VVADFDPLCEIQSDKATMEITSRYAGTIVTLHHAPGDMVPVGAPLVDIRMAGGGGSASGAGAPAPAPAAAAAKQVMPSTGGSEGPPAEAAAGGGGGRVHASPAVRRLAKEAGVELSAVPATGPEGRVTRENVEAWLQARGGGAAVAPLPGAHSQAAAPLTAPPLPPLPAAPAAGPGPAAEDAGVTRVPLRGFARCVRSLSCACAPLFSPQNARRRSSGPNRSPLTKTLYETLNFSLPAGRWSSP
jgi:pyruvate/2-oxoglutarate dehydrogenase complex dihydrolipoamide acyltransferase (E2) component